MLCAFTAHFGLQIKHARICRLSVSQFGACAAVDFMFRCTDYQLLPHTRTQQYNNMPARRCPFWAFTWECSAYSRSNSPCIHSQLRLCSQVPFLGICLGMQCAVIEYARSVLGWTGANSAEFDSKSPHPVSRVCTVLLGMTIRASEYSHVLNSQFYTIPSARELRRDAVRCSYSHVCELFCL